jgi:serine/threonine-protein kinase
MGRDAHRRWEATTLGRDKAGARGSERNVGVPDRSGSVRAIALDPDRYSITDRLGEGGMGEVRRCQDSLLDRSVALKVVRRDADIDDFETRFLREARVQARLAHPGVVPVYDVGRDDNGRVYFTMKRVEGVTVEDVMVALRSGTPLPNAQRYDTRQLLTAFARACLTVDYAHSRGVLHRDLKPANLMLGAYGEVYVLDWGLAKVQDIADDIGEIAMAPARRERETEVGVAMGTPAYMAPEQAWAKPLDPRADVFSLGAILYEILTLDPLLDEHAIRVIRSGQRLQIHPRTGVDELDAIVFRATAFDAQDRFPSARALHDAVEHFLTADEEQRVLQRRAAQHVERAQVLSQDDESRSAALEELGAALALVPEDDGARAHLVHLLRHPPAATPREVRQRRLEHEIARLRQVQAVVASAYFVAWAIAYPVLVYLGGVQNTFRAAVAPAVWLFAALVIGVQYWTKRHESAISWSGIAGAAALAATSLIWGPLFIVPGLAVVLLFGQLLVAQKRQRAHLVVLFGAAVAVPSYLVLRGYWNVYTPVGADQFAIHGSVGVTRIVFYGGLLVAHLAQTLFGARFAARYRDALDQRVLENALFSWQLANLVPRGGSSLMERRIRPTALSIDMSRGPSNDEAFVRESARYQVDGDVPDSHRYTRLAHIGQTRHTEVWRCIDRRLGRPVDMHVAKSQADDVATLAEARATGRLEHPTVAPVYDVGTNAHGRVYYTIKNVGGVPLLKAIEQITNDRAYRRTLAAFQQVCLAIAYAHERGVYHRSLDLSSVVLGGFGEVYVNGWSAKPFESVRERQLDIHALKGILGRIVQLYRAEIPGIDRAKTPRELHDLVEAFLSGTRDAEALFDLANDHLERAKQAAARAFGGVSFDVEAEERVVALREVGRAVRLDPANEEAIRLLFRLITEPPSKAPPAVREEVERLREQRSRGPARTSAVFGGAWLVVYPVIAYLLGVRSMTSIVVIWSAWAVVEAVLLVAVFKGGSKRGIPWPMLATMFAGIVTASLMGPFFYTPIIAAFATMSFVLVVPRGWRTATMFLGSLIVLIPMVLGASGAYSASDVVDNVVLSKSTLSATSHETTLLILTAMHLLGLVFAAEYAARFRDRLDRVEHAYLLRAWQLKKLVRA